MKTIINITIDNQSILDDLESCDIAMQDGSFCFSVDLRLKSKRFWDLSDPANKTGELRIKVIIGDTTYQFLIEERDSDSTSAGVDFSVWGRSKQAMLAAPFSRTVSDTEDSTHPWQTGDTTASAIIAYAITNYCDDPPAVSWNVENFVVYQDSFSVNNQSPIEIISSLADVIGAELVANIDGSLSVETYSVETDIDTAVESYNDFDAIIQLSESIDVPSGYNAVTVYGYDDNASAVDAYISAEAVDNETRYPGRDHTVRVYYYHREGEAPIYSFPEGSCQPRGGGVETITENVRLIFGQGNTSKPNTEGISEVSGSGVIPIETISVTYTVNYQDFAVRGDTYDEYNVLFYFSDKSAYTVYSFTVAETSGASLCESVILTLDSPDTVVCGQHAYIRVYGSVTGLHSSEGNKPVFKNSGHVETITDETVIFTNNSGSLSYPVKSIIKITSQVGGFTHYPGSKTITGKGGGDFAKFFVASITYTTEYSLYTYMVPLTARPTVVIWGYPDGCDTPTSLSLSISDSGVARDITINVKDYATGVTVSGANIAVDGESAGMTDASGNITLNGVAVGDHSIEIEKDGYLKNVDDDLANKTFTVEAVE